MTSEILTLAEAASLLQCCPHTLSKMAREGKVPGMKLGREWRFSRKKLLEVINGRDSAQA